MGSLARLYRRGRVWRRAKKKSPFPRRERAGVRGNERVQCGRPRKPVRGDRKATLGPSRFSRSRPPTGGWSGTVCLQTSSGSRIPPVTPGLASRSASALRRNSRANGWTKSLRDTIVYSVQYCIPGTAARGLSRRFPSAHLGTRTPAMAGKSRSMSRARQQISLAQLPCTITQLGASAPGPPAWLSISRATAVRWPSWTRMSV